VNIYHVYGVDSDGDFGTHITANTRGKAHAIFCWAFDMEWNFPIHIKKLGTVNWDTSDEILDSDSDPALVLDYLQSKGNWERIGCTQSGGYNVEAMEHRIVNYRRLYPDMDEAAFRAGLAAGWSIDEAGANWL
jgi:hypothetical protein